MMLLHSAEHVLMDDYPIIPIYFTRGRRLVKPFVGGAKINPSESAFTPRIYFGNRAVG